jgi:hypothetical protein
MDSGTNKIDLRMPVLIGIILATAFSRLIPHMPNFSPLGAIGLFGAAHFQKRWQAFIIPLAAVWISDILINNIVYSDYYPSFTLFYSGFYWQNGSYLLITLAGIIILKKINIKNLAFAFLTSTAIFFIITNFGCWPGSPVYTQDLRGLLTCYAAGIPFLKGTLLGDLFYSGVLFGAFYLLEQKFQRLRIANGIFQN